MSADLLAERPSHSSAFSAVVRKPFSSFSVASILAPVDSSDAPSSPPPPSNSASPPSVSRIHQTSPIRHHDHHLLTSSPINSLNNSLNSPLSTSLNSSLNSTLSVSNINKLINSPNSSPSPKHDPQSPIVSFNHFRNSPPSSCSPPHLQLSPDHHKQILHHQHLLQQQQHSLHQVRKQQLSLKTNNNGNEILQQSPEDLSTSSSRLSEDNRCSDGEEGEDDEEEIHVDNDSDEEMRSDTGIIDPIPCYPPHVLHPGYPSPHGGVTGAGGVPPPPLPGSWPSLQFLHHQLALRALESEYTKQKQQSLIIICYRI